LDEQEEYYYKNINTMEDYFNFVETLDAEYNLYGMKK
jgi:hypothetical protein